MANHKALADIENLLKDHVPGKVLEQHLEPLTQFGENFGSTILNADFTIKNGDGKHKIHAVAKMLPTEQFALEIFDVQNTFRSEILFYSKVIPTLQKFQKEQGASTIADYFPIFYGGRISLNPNSDVVDDGAIILMENLKTSGFVVENRHQGFDLETTKLILDHLANFHASSRALKLKQPEVFENVIKPCLTGWVDRIFEDTPPEIVIKVLRENRKMMDYIGRLTKLYKNVKRPIPVREPWAGLIHQDLWLNNIMLKHEKHHASQIKMVDFQSFDYGSFAKDLIFFLFSSIQTPVVKLHFDKLLRYYYDQYIKTLKELKVNTSEFTYKSFEQELLKEGGQLAHSLDMLFIVMGPKADQTPSLGGIFPPKEGEMPQIRTSHFMKERIWAIVEIAAKKNWI